MWLYHLIQPGSALQRGGDQRWRTSPCSRPTDRREFLRRGAALLTIGATPALLAACGGSSNSGSAAAPKASGNIDYPVVGGLRHPAHDEGLEGGEQRRVKPTYIGNHDEIQAKIKAGGGSYDLITYYQGYKPLYTELDILTTLDTDKIPNIDGLFRVLQGGRRPEPLDRRGRHLDGRSMDLGLDRDHLGRCRARPAASPRGTTSSTRSSRARSASSTTRSGAFTLTAHILGIRSGRTAEGRVFGDRGLPHQDRGTGEERCPVVR